MEMQALTPQDDMVTVFCQGNSTARSQAAKYCGAQGVHYRRPNGTLEYAVARNAPPQLLYNVYDYGDMDDVGYGCPWGWYAPLYLLTVIKSILTLWWFRIRGASWTHVKLGAMNVAGAQDVAHYICAVRACIRDNPTKRLVLFGCSRGAATVLVALRHFTAVERAHIALALVEAPFDTLASVFSCWFGAWGARVLTLFARCTSYRARQESPMEAVSHDAFPLDLPLGFIASRTDTTVPLQCTQALIRKLVQRDHQALHQLLLERAHHSEMPYAAGASYNIFVHALYSEVLQ